MTYIDYSRVILEESTSSVHKKIIFLVVYYHGVPLCAGTQFM